MDEPEDDPYRSLKPMPPSPPDEICRCVGDVPIVLRGDHMPNPIACAECFLEVPPERLGLAESVAQELSYWQALHHCFYFLWLDSGEFEAWAVQELSDPTSRVNRTGMSAVETLSSTRRAFYWWFQQRDLDDFVPLSLCPVCERGLSPFGEVFICDRCRVFVAN